MEQALAVLGRVETEAVLAPEDVEVKVNRIMETMQTQEEPELAVQMEQLNRLL